MGLNGSYKSTSVSLCVAGVVVATVYVHQRLRSACLRIVVFLDGPNGCSKSGNTILLPYRHSVGLQHLCSAVCSKLQLHQVQLYGLSSKQQLTQTNLHQLLKAEEAAAGGTVILIATAADSLSESAVSLGRCEPLPWAPGELLPRLGHQVSYSVWHQSDMTVYAT